MLVYSITARTSFDFIRNIRRIISQKMKEVGKVLNNICGRLTCIHLVLHWSCTYIELEQQCILYCITYKMIPIKETIPYDVLLLKEFS